MFNVRSADEKALLGKVSDIFAEARASSHRGAAGQTPVWTWSGTDGGKNSRPCVLLLHGWGGEAGLMGAFVKPLLSNGYQVVIPDLPGQGKSEGRLVDTRLSAATIVEMGHELGPFQAIIGHSLGGLLACLVSSGHDAVGGKTDVQKLVTINSPISLGSVIDGLGAAIGLSPQVIGQVAAKAETDLGLPLADAHAQVLLNKAAVPTLAFHDNDDPFIPTSSSLANLAKHPKLDTRHTTGHGHINSLQDDAIIQQVMDFLGPAH